MSDLKVRRPKPQAPAQEKERGEIHLKAARLGRLRFALPAHKKREPLRVPLFVRVNAREWLSTGRMPLPCDSGA